MTHEISLLQSFSLHWLLLSISNRILRVNREAREGGGEGAGGRGGVEGGLGGGERPERLVGVRKGQTVMR